MSSRINSSSILRSRNGFYQIFHIFYIQCQQQQVEQKVEFLRSMSKKYLFKGCNAPRIIELLRLTSYNQTSCWIWLNSNLHAPKNKTGHKYKRLSSTYDNMIQLRDIGFWNWKKQNRFGVWKMMNQQIWTFIMLHYQIYRLEFKAWLLVLTNLTTQKPRYF